MPQVQELQREEDQGEEAGGRRQRGGLRADQCPLRKSVAFPALGTGVGGFPLDECARIMISEVRQHSAEKTELERVVFALFDQFAYQAFKQELEKHMS